MIAFAVAGYVLFFNPNLLNEIRDAINAALPPSMADTINPIIDQAIAQRNTVAAFGLLAALYSGIGWMTNLREALSEQWAQSPEPPALPKRLLFDLIALFGLGIALVGSFAITGAAASASPQTCWRWSGWPTRDGRSSCCGCSASCSACSRTSWCSSG